MYQLQNRFSKILVNNNARIPTFISAKILIQNFFFLCTRFSPFSDRTSRNSLHLTHWGRVTHICVSKLTHIASDNGLSPGRRQAIIWTNAEILLIGTLGTNFSEILIEILTFSFTKMRLKVSSAKWRPSCLGFNELIVCGNLMMTQSPNLFCWHWNPRLHILWSGGHQHSPDLHDQTP